LQHGFQSRLHCNRLHSQPPIRHVGNIDVGDDLLNLKDACEWSANAPAVHYPGTASCKKQNSLATFQGVIAINTKFANFELLQRILHMYACIKFSNF
jgi:hypothetical protein